MSRVFKNNGFWHCQDLARGQHGWHLRHPWIHGAWSDVPSEPQSDCGLLRRRSDGLRVHVRKGKWIKKVSNGSLCFIEAIPWKIKERNTRPYSLKANSDPQGRHPLWLDSRSSWLYQPNDLAQTPKQARRPRHRRDQATPLVTHVRLGCPS